MAGVQIWKLGHTPGLGGNAAVLVTLFLFDKLFAWRYGSARWFAVHAFANFLVVITALSGLFSCTADPLFCADATKYDDASSFGPSSPWPILITNTVHVYHMIGGFRLSGADYFHHLMFIPTIGFFGQYWAWGPIRNALAFFISGFPGGLLQGPREI